MNGEVICVEYADDLDVPKATKSLTANRASTKYRSGLIVQSMQNGKERMISIIPNCKAMAIKPAGGSSRKRKKSEHIKTRKSKLRGKRQRHIHSQQKAAGVETVESYYFLILCCVRDGFVFELEWQ